MYRAALARRCACGHQARISVSFFERRHAPPTRVVLGAGRNLEARGADGGELTSCLTGPSRSRNRFRLRCVAGAGPRLLVVVHLHRDRRALFQLAGRSPPAARSARRRRRCIPATGRRPRSALQPCWHRNRSFPRRRTCDERCPVLSVGAGPEFPGLARTTSCGSIVVGQLRVEGDLKVLASSGTYERLRGSSRSGRACRANIRRSPPRNVRRRRHACRLVAGGCPGIDPRDNRLNLFVGQAALVREDAARALGEPGRHLARLDPARDGARQGRASS